MLFRSTAVGFGVLYLVIGLAHGRPVDGVLGLVVLVGFGGFLAVRRERSEPAALLAGDTSDERRQHIQVRASAATGRVLGALVVLGLFWSLAFDTTYAGVFTVLSAASGASLVASTLWYSRRG